MNSSNPTADRTSSDGTARIDVQETWGGTSHAGTGSGLDLLRAMVTGEVLPPPAMALLGIELVSVADGGATLRRKPGDNLFNPMRPVHGSAVAALSPWRSAPRSSPPCRPAGPARRWTPGSATCVPSRPRREP